MPPGVDQLKHIVVLMMENRSFDHMLGGLKKDYPAVDGLNGSESNPDVNGNAVAVSPQAKYQSQLDPDPDHHFPAVDQQIFDGDTSLNRVATMTGFVRSYYQQRHDLAHSRRIMYYFDPKKLTVITTLATEFALFNAWFASIPGPTLCNRAFAHYGTSFGHVGMEPRYANQKYVSIYERMRAAGRTAKVYYYDQTSSTIEVANLLDHQAEFFGTFDQFLGDCKAGILPDYSFVEPNYSDHTSATGARIIANDQHPDHHVLAGERFIAQVYNAIRTNDQLWPSTALLLVYDEHGGIFDHVPPPACMPDEFQASAQDTGTGMPFLFDRLGVRVPAVLISPWVPRGAIVPGVGQPNARVFEHASIPSTVTAHFIGPCDSRSPREKAADTFLDLLSAPTARTDAPAFQL
jgi:phospholipase C